MNEKEIVEIKKFLIIFILLLFTFCLSSSSDSVSSNSVETYTCPDCNVILISLDCLRADHLGSYGYTKNTSPNIDKLASESVLFENAIVQASWTAPSHMSIMTSLYPSVHKVQKYPKGGIKNVSVDKIDDSVVTLAQVLRANGYHTISFNGGGYVWKPFGFDRGFDKYAASDFDKIVNKTLGWLYKNRGTKFFLFFHTYAVHSPYTPPAPYIYRFFPTYNDSTDKMYTLEKAARKSLKNDETWKVIALYDGEINYVDHEMGRLLGGLDNLNLSNNTIIILTSDHGEGFREHGGFGHTTNSYQELIHVPLVIKFPGIKNGRVKNLVQSIDIMPTILDSLNITVPSQVQGVSLLPLIREEGNVNSYAYSEGGYNGEIKAIIDGNLTWKYIYNTENKKEELYNLENDPTEQKNLINERPEIAESLREELFSWMEENEKLAESYTTSSAELENETKEALKNLGYMV